MKTPHEIFKELDASPEILKHVSWPFKLRHFFWIINDDWIVWMYNALELPKDNLFVAYKTWSSTKESKFKAHLRRKSLDRINNEVKKRMNITLHDVLMCFGCRSDFREWAKNYKTIEEIVNHCDKSGWIFCLYEDILYNSEKPLKISKMFDESGEDNKADFYRKHLGQEIIDEVNRILK